MSEKITRQVLYLVAAVTVVAGLALTVGWHRERGALHASLEAKARQLERLQAVRMDVERYEVARQAVAGLPEGRPLPLSDLVEQGLAGTEIGETRDFLREPTPGWRLRQKELALDDVSLAEAMAFIHRVEQSSMEADEPRRPPWRLASFTAAASAHAPGVGRVVLLLEALERSPGAEAGR